MKKYTFLFILSVIFVALAALTCNKAPVKPHRGIDKVSGTGTGTTTTTTTSTTGSKDYYIIFTVHQTSPPGPVVEGADVNLYMNTVDRENQGTAPFHDMTNAQGIVQFKNLAPATYYYSASKDIAGKSYSNLKDWGNAASNNESVTTTAGMNNKNIAIVIQE